ncbi:hypothetical protein BaRGS_00018374 [Batillaria attramentaria]|uniref:Uncharacterized protein n=1 Tax=Batillaria attramentaria TaxID=370345 RepID=A0ABD0KT93_9CAEN
MEQVGTALQTAMNVLLPTESESGLHYHSSTEGSRTGEKYRSGEHSDPTVKAANEQEICHFHTVSYCPLLTWSASPLTGQPLAAILKLRSATASAKFPIHHFPFCFTTLPHLIIVMSKSQLTAVVLSGSNSCTWTCSLCVSCSVFPPRADCGQLVLNSPLICDSD